MGYFTKHAKSSAALVSLAVHAVVIVVALFFVAVTVIQKNEAEFKAKPVIRPKMALKKLQVPVYIKKSRPKPKLRKRIVSTPKLNQSLPNIKIPEITGVPGGLGNVGGSGLGAGSIGFSMPELDFFGAKAKGEKVVFVVHFGPATISAGRREGETEEYYTPFSRMTGLTIRNRLADLVDTLPEYSLFNVIAYYASDAWAMEPAMQRGTDANKQKLREWMAPVNPLEGSYTHCFSKSPKTVWKARQSYPTRVDNLPFYATKWAYPYYVPEELVQRYAPDAPDGIMHWGRGVSWAILEQKADTIFILTTNYIDGWQTHKKEGGKKVQLTPINPQKMARTLGAMCVDVYGPDDDNWPTINVVVLPKAGQDPTVANRVVSSEFGPIIRTFDSEGSVIDDIKDFMNDKELDLYYKYKSEYGNKQ
jgi:hypothetical protein